MNYGISEAQAEGSQRDPERSGNGEEGSIWELPMDSNCVYYFYTTNTDFVICGL